MKLRKKSRFDPAISNATLEVFQNTVTNEVLKKWDHTSEKNKTIQNITKGERRALQELCRDETTITKKADKGGAIVLMNCTDYMEEANLQTLKYIGN